MRDNLLALVSLALAAAILGRAIPGSSPQDADGSVWEKLAARSDVTKRDITWDPPADLVVPLQETWDHEMATYTDPLGFKNYGYDQIMANGG